MAWWLFSRPRTSGSFWNGAVRVLMLAKLDVSMNSIHM
jgi:hypothetical protein